jgi:beta-galactosidase GanA
MSPVENSPVNNTATSQSKTRLEVFVSYAEEDAPLVNEITEELSKPNFVVDTDTIKDGDRWREKINDD